MQRRLAFLVAAMAATSAAPALAQQDPGKMFMINAVTPGVVSFSGEGTAQFNNTSSTSNAFSVGSSTNFGVNASASSTNDYMVDANALLKLAGTSQLQQTIGTSSSAANTLAASEAAASAASTIAASQADVKYGETWADYQLIKGASETVGNDSPAGFTAESFTTEAQYNAARDAFTKTSTSDAYSLVTEAATQSSSQGASGNGIISGDFLSSNKSRSDIGATAAVVAENTTKANAESNERFGTVYTDYQTKFNAVAGTGGLINTETEKAQANAAGILYNEATGGIQTETNWETAKSDYTNSTFSSLQNAAESAGSAENESNAVVTVTGVGSIATLNASDESAFNVDVATRIRNQLMATNGTANGSAGGNLATSSFANQANASTASAFMQAFGADTVELKATPDGILSTAIINGRFDVQLDALATGTGPTEVLQAPVITVPK
jgi:hypothetical protein